MNFEGKKVFTRCDFNVPLDEGLQITNDLRITNALPTLKKILDDGGRLILASHLGRPKGERNSKFSLKPVAKRLSELLGQEVPLVDDCVGPVAEEAANNLKNGQAILLENVRFHKEETSKDEEDIKTLSLKFSKFADIFVNDAFGTAHRAHASVVGLSQHVESVAGYLIQKELEYFGKITTSTEKPIAAIIGGAKVSDKILLIENMLQKVDKLIIGGAMAYTFRYAQGFEIGDSLVEKDRKDTALNILKKAQEEKVELILPVDNVIADDFSNNANTKIVNVEEGIPKGWEGIDVGPKTLEIYKHTLEETKVVIWNGPVGVFEIDKFSNGTKTLAQILANSSATTVIGGGDTAAAVIKFGQDTNMSHISTGGGASLELLEGKELPGISCLTDK